MAVIIDLTEGVEAFGEETTFFGGTVSVGETPRCIDGMTDRDGDYAWLGWVIGQIELQLGLQEDTDGYVDQLVGTLYLGNKYEAALVDGKLVVTEISEPTKSNSDILGLMIDLLRENGVIIDSPYAFENWVADNASHSQQFVATGRFPGNPTKSQDL